MEQASSVTNPGTDSGGPLSAVLAEAAAVMATEPAYTERRAREILDSIPGQQQALFLLVCARRVQGDPAGARALLEDMAKAQPELASVQYELALLSGALGENKKAVTALSHVVELEPNHPAAWRALGNELVQSGRSSAAAQPYASHVRSAVKELKLLEDALGGSEEQFAAAENMLRELLKVQPTDVFTIYVLAQIALRQERHGQAEQLLARVLELAPGFLGAREQYIEALGHQMKWKESTAEIDFLLKNDPQNVKYRALEAQNLRLLGEYAEAEKAYENLLAEHPEEPILWTAYGHVLRELGRTDECIAAYRRSIALRPVLGKAWWGLANLKTFRFTPAEIQTVRKQLADGVDEEDRVDLHFTLAKALEDDGAYADSFEQYRLANALLWRRSHSDRSSLDQHVNSCKALFTPEFFAARAGFGCPSPDPIFVIGLPRAGSTLVEQILASHSAIEGTMELPDIVHISERLARRADGDAATPYPGNIGTLSEEQLRSLGEEYLERTRYHRKLGRPLFIDKSPQNLAHVGFIHAILPNAKIIDIRRHPMGCGFSVYKQHFTIGMNFTYDLADIGHYYRRYVELMAHFDTVLPGRVHRVFYEDLVQNPEREIRRLLDYCGVPFEDSCLRFHETERNVRTISSEQVRRPMYTEAMEHWRNFEPWLGSLKKALGPVLDSYPAIPVF